MADDPDMVAQAVKNEIAKRKSFFFTKEEFLRAKKVIYATECLSFNSTSETANRLASAALEGCDMLDYASVIQNTCYEEVKERFMKGYDMERSVISIVFPERLNALKECVLPMSHDSSVRRLLQKELHFPLPVEYVNPYTSS